MGTRDPILACAAVLLGWACSADVDAPPVYPVGGGDPAQNNDDDDDPFRSQNDAGDGDADTDADADADSDADADADSDADADTDADGDADAIGGGDVAGPLDGCADAASCDQMAAQLLDALNAARGAAGGGGCQAGPLAWNAALAAVAHAHSAHMAAVGALTNEDPGGGIDDRLDAAGVGWSSAGEVYGVVPGTAAETIEDWMAEPAIHEYLVSCEWPLAGFGVVPGAGPRAPAWVTLTMIAP